MNSKEPKINSELLAITYGGIVKQVINDSECLEEVNQTLERIGYNIGIRIVDEFMASVNVCNQFEQIVHTFVKDGLRTFLGVSVEIKDFVYQFNENKQKMLNFYITINENPILNYVELPAELKPLQYQNILCGIIRGAFFTLNHTGKVSVSRDSLKSLGQKTILRVEMKKEKISYGED